MITASVLVLRRARDDFFGFICHKKYRRKMCLAVKPVVSSYQFHMHTASDTPTDRQTHTNTHTFASHPLCPITFVVLERAQQNRLTELLSRGTCVSITERKMPAFSVFLRQNHLRRERRFFSARLRPIDNVRCVANHSSEWNTHPPNHCTSASPFKCRRV